MGRKEITDGTKKEQIYHLVQQRYVKAIGKERLKQIFDKAIEKEIHNIEKGKVSNQVNLLDSIAEIEKSIK